MVPPRAACQGGIAEEKRNGEATVPLSLRGICRALDSPYPRELRRIRTHRAAWAHAPQARCRRREEPRLRGPSRRAAAKKKPRARSPGPAITMREKQTSRS